METDNREEIIVNRLIVAAVAAAFVVSPLAAQTPPTPAPPPPPYGVGIGFGKAVTANNFKRPTKALQDGIAQGGVNLRILGQPGVTPLEGGVPIVVDGKIVGAIGASGVLSSQDAEVAMAGAAAAAAK